MLIRLLLFGMLNFGGLAIGAYFTNPGVASDWYQNMQKAPWTPPGWVFGASWTCIMICFSIYLAILWDKIQDLALFNTQDIGFITSDEPKTGITIAKYKSQLIYLYTSALMLNVIWNPLFFYLHQMGTAALVIVTLTLLIFFLGYRYYSYMHAKTWLLAPYAFWMCIATSLNIYSLLMN